LAQNAQQPLQSLRYAKRAADSTEHTYKRHRRGRHNGREAACDPEVAGLIQGTRSRHQEQDTTLL